MGNEIVQTKIKSFKVLGIALSTIGVLAICVIIILCSAIFYTIYSVSTSMKSLANYGATSKISGFKLNYTMPRSTNAYIAGIKLYGEINNNKAIEIIDKLESAKNDRAAIGILLDVNSPGGAVVPSQEIYDEILSLRTIKPVVVYVRNMAASGAYYASASASKIIANRSSLIGSIGVIMEGFETDKLLKYLKINPVTIKTGELKDSGSPLRPMNDADKKYLYELINTIRAQFAQDVKKSRELNDLVLNFMADGRVVVAPQALDLHLIDSIGSRSMALNQIAQLSHSKQTPELFYYENISSLTDFMTQSFTEQMTGFLSKIFFDRSSIL